MTRFGRSIYAYECVYESSAGRGICNMQILTQQICDGGSMRFWTFYQPHRDADTSSLGGDVK